MDSLLQMQIPFLDPHLQLEILRLEKVDIVYGAGRHMGYHHACPNLMAVGLYRGSCRFLKTWNPWSAAFRLMEVSFGSSFLSSNSGVAWAQMRWFELTKIFNSDWCTSAAERNSSVNSVRVVNDWIGRENLIDKLIIFLKSDLASLK